MLVDNTNGYLDEVKQWAKEEGILPLLQKELDYLDTYAEHGERGRTKCILSKDFAPQSFTFTLLAKQGEEWEYLFNGGLIYYGEYESGVGSPQFSVRLGSQTRGWSVHT